MINEQIIEATKNYFCYGIEKPDLEVRIDFARSLKPREIVVDFGTGRYGRTALAMAMANPNITIFTFDSGVRKDITPSDAIRKMENRKRKQGVKNVIFKIADAKTIKWDKQIAGLNIDAEGHYKETKIEIEKWFPFVKDRGIIFMQSYNLSGEKDYHKGIKKATDEYLEKHKEYQLGKLYHNTMVLRKK